MDNATAKIGFSGLTTCTDAKELYQNVFDLLGSMVGVPCGTCTTFYGVTFQGGVDDITITPTSFANGSSISTLGIVDLSAWKGFTNDAGEAVDCFTKIEELIKKQSKDPTLDDTAKKAQTQSLAEENAKGLRDVSAEQMQKVIDINDHYDRIVLRDDYDIIMYDYRDTNTLVNVNAPDSDVITLGKKTQKIPYSYYVPGTEVEMPCSIKVVASAQNPDYIPIDLPLLDAETLGIKGYDISQYAVTREYSQEYLKKLQEWEQDYTIEVSDESYVIPAVPAHTRKEPRQRFIWDENGEKVPETYEVEVFVPEEPEKKVPKFTEKIIHNRPKPIPQEGDVREIVTYNGSSNRIIADALSYVTSCRSRLGAQQNRLEHAYNNNENKNENLSAAESLIRDTDMASEMVSYTQKNILMQAGQAMITQANQSNQGVLNLLR